MKQLFVLVSFWLIVSLANAKGIARKAQGDFERRLRDLTESEEPLAVERGVCDVHSMKVGCYKDNGRGITKTLNELLFTDRSKQSPKFSGKLIDWHNFEDYLADLTCRCAKAAKEKGYTHFGLQYYGECLSGPHASQKYNRDGPTSACTNPQYGVCNEESAQLCVGKAHASFVYRVTEEGSGNGQIDSNAYDA